MLCCALRKRRLARSTALLVAPSSLVGQAVLGHQAHRQLLDAPGVVAFGQGQVSLVNGEVAVAVGAVMLGVGEDDVEGAAGAGIAQVVQGACGNGVAAGAAATAGATAGRVVPAAA